MLCKYSTVRLDQILFLFNKSKMKKANLISCKQLVNLANSNHINLPKINTGER